MARPELVHDFYREGERKPPLEGLPNVPENGALTRDLYLDLLINTLANTIYQDRSIDPSNAGSFQPGLRAEGRDWPAVAHTMIGVQRLKNVQELAQRVINEGVPGDFVEAGVWRGGCCILMRGILEAYGISASRPTGSPIARSMRLIPSQACRLQIRDRFLRIAPSSYIYILNLPSRSKKSRRTSRVMDCSTIKSCS